MFLCNLLYFVLRLLDIQSRGYKTNCKLQKQIAELLFSFVTLHFCCNFLFFPPLSDVWVLVLLCLPASLLTSSHHLLISHHMHTSYHFTSHHIISHIISHHIISLHPTCTYAPHHTRSPQIIPKTSIFIWKNHTFCFP